MDIAGIGRGIAQAMELARSAPSAAAYMLPSRLPAEPATPQPVLEVEVNSFIPHEQVSTPWFVPGGGTFAGDGRDIGQDGTQRTQQTIQVFEDPGAASGYRVEVEADIGETHKLDDDGNVVRTGEASEGDLKAEVLETREDGTLVVRLSGQSPNPLVGVAPGITYEVTVEMRPNADGTWTVTSSGTHDAFPGYEVLATVDGGDQQVVYGYDPGVNGSTPISLAQGDGLLGLIWGGSSVDVSGSLTVGPDTLTPETLIERHTAADGTVDVDALGTDLAAQADAGNADADFIDGVFARLPEGDRETAANAFFDGLATTPGLGGGPHSEYVALALTPEGMQVLLAAGAYAPDRLAHDAIVYGYASQNREAIHSGDADACAMASAFLDALADSPEAQRNLADFLDPLYDSDEEGLASTPEGRALHAAIDRVV